AQLFAAPERWHIAQAFQFLMNALQALGRHKDIDILGKPPKAMKEHRHAAGHCIGYGEFLQPPRYLFQRLMNSAFPFEVHASLPEGPAPIAIKLLFVSDHGSPQEHSTLCSRVPPPLNRDGVWPHRPPAGWGRKVRKAWTPF